MVLQQEKMLCCVGCTKRERGTHSKSLFEEPYDSQRQKCVFEVDTINTSEQSGEMHVHLTTPRLLNVDESCICLKV